MAETVRQTTVFDSQLEHIGKVYGRALVGATEAAGVTEAVLAEYDAFLHDVLDRLPKLDAVLASPRVPADAKTGMLDKAFGGTMSHVLLNFLKVVCQHERFEAIRVISRAAHRLHHELSGCVDVLIRTAAPLDEAVRGQVHTRLEQQLGQRVNLAATVDPQLIGGLVVRVGDTVYDASVSNRLERMRIEALERASQSIKQSAARFETAE
jgi:F-type H+-transporting ATPase subunit delta